jgi:YD repeat-containing protein
LNLAATLVDAGNLSVAGANTLTPDCHEYWQSGPNPITTLALPAAGGTWAVFSVSGSINGDQNSYCGPFPSTGNFGVASCGCNDSRNGNLVGLGTDGYCYCLSPYKWSEKDGACILEQDIDRTKKSAGNACYGNPIYPVTGVKRESIDTGLRIGPTGLRLTYDSGRAAPITPAGEIGPPPLDAPAFGALWFSNLHRRLEIGPNKRGARATRGDGRVVSFVGDGTGVFTADADSNDRLLSITGGYRYIDAAERTEENFDANGVLQSVAYASGQSLTFSYSDSSTPTTVAPAPGYLIQVLDTFGRTLGFRYGSTGVITQIIDVNGNSTSVSYDASGSNLTQLTWADTTSRSFVYELAAMPWALTGVIDERALRYSTFGYDAQGRATSTEHAGGVDRYSVTFGTPPQMLVTETLDQSSGITYRYFTWAQDPAPVVALPTGSSTSLQTTLAGTSLPVVTSRSQAAGSGCNASTSAATYDANANLTSADDFDGNRTCYWYDTSRNLETVRIEGLTTAQACSSVLNSPLPSGARRIATQWHPDWRVPVRQVEAKKITTWVYNGQPDPFNGGAVASCAPSGALLPDGKPIAVLCKRVEQATTNADGNQGRDATDGADPYASSVVLHLRMDGANGGVTFTDSSTKAHVPSNVVAPVVTDTSNAYIGTASANFTGGYLWYADSSDWNMGSGDFTIETWVKFNSASVNQRVFFFGKSASDGSSTVVSLGKGTDNKLVLYWYTSAGVFSSVVDSVAVAANTWYAIAVVRSGGTMTFWKNGAVVGTGAISGALSTNSYHLGIGVLGEYTYAYGGAYGTRMMGWIDDLRITKGVARYSSTSPPPVSGDLLDASVPSRPTTYTYDLNGQPLTMKGPRSDVNDTTTYAYYATTTTDYSTGDLSQVTNPAGQITQYPKYNKSGQVLRSIDPNGVITDYTYDARQRLTSMTVGGLQTAYAYDAAGELTQVTLPDTATIAFTYDGAHRLTKVTDQAGNSVSYTLDNAGNRIQDQVKDPGGVLRRTVTRVFDALGRVQQVTGAPQ